MSYSSNHHCLPDLNQRHQTRRWFYFQPLAALAATLAVVLSTAQAQVPTQAPLETIPLFAGMHRVNAELAITPEQRAIGLMGRTHMADNAGMLFVFQDANMQCFWMANTLIPLSIAFLKNDGTITNIAHMQPQSRTSHCSTEPVRFALEVNQGWFEQRNIQAGQIVRGLPPSP